MKNSTLIATFIMLTALLSACNTSPVQPTPNGEISLRCPDVNYSAPEVIVNVPDSICPDVVLPEIKMPKPVIIEKPAQVVYKKCNGSVIAALKDAANLKIEEVDPKRNNDLAVLRDSLARLNAIKEHLNTLEKEFAGCL